MPAEALANNYDQETDSVLEGLVKETEDDFYQLVNEHDKVAQALEADPNNSELREKEEKLQNYLEEVSELNKKYLELINKDNNTDKKLGEAATSIEIDKFYDTPSEEGHPHDEPKFNVEQSTGRVTKHVSPDGFIYNPELGKPNTERYEGR